jgi:hypothetical protein
MRSKVDVCLRSQPRPTHKEKHKAAAHQEEQEAVLCKCNAEADSLCARAVEDIPSSQRQDRSFGDERHARGQDDPHVRSGRNTCMVDWVPLDRIYRRRWIW